MENLFSYGTLQYRKVQIETFGRILNGTNDILIGYKLKELKIKNQDVINTSGKENHPIIYKTGNKSDGLSSGTSFGGKKSVGGDESSLDLKALGQTPDVVKAFIAN